MSLSIKVCHLRLTKTRHTVKNEPKISYFVAKCLQIAPYRVILHRVFHSIRFKVNKVGIQRYPFFYAFFAKTDILFCLLSLAADTLTFE